MMLSKSIALGVAVVAMASAVVVVTTRARPGAGPTETTSLVPSNDGSNNAPAHPQQDASGGRLPKHGSEKVDEHTDGGDRNGGGGRDTSSNGTRNRLPGGRQERAKNGAYMTTFAGFYRGSGTADVASDKVSIKAVLTTSDGRTGDLVANNLIVEGPYFYGTGTVLGETVQVTGRVDAARASRLVATILGGDGRASRAVGNLPASQDPGDDAWDQGRNGNGDGGGNGGGGNGGGGHGGGNPAGK